MTDSWRALYLAALRAGDRRAALAVVDDARLAGIDLATLYLEVFQPSLREIGRLWQLNEITVADEHLATAVTQIAMARLYDDIAGRAVPNGRMLLAACAVTERHEVGLRMVCDLLELDGWDVRYLGAAVPEDSVVGMVLSHRPDALALSASIAPHLPQLRAMIRSVRVACGAAAPFIIVGGRPFLEDETLAQRLGADAVAHDAAEAVRCVRERFR
jgi:methanogenic corrinoid protein MtbC1